jgi:KaiC/GvpD/RAD55 family RecA-like ATPase
MKMSLEDNKSYIKYIEAKRHVALEKIGGVNSDEFKLLEELYKKRAKGSEIIGAFNNCDKLKQLNELERRIVCDLVENVRFRNEDVYEPQEYEDNLFSAKELIESNIPDIKWLVENIIPAESIVILGGDVGNLKTFTALHIAACCATGKKVFGNRETKRIRVLYIDEENRKITLKKRMCDLLKGLDSNNDIDMDFLICDNIKLDVRDRRSHSRLNEIIRDYNPELIVVDSLVRVMVGNENDVQEVRKVFEIIKEFIKKYGSSWLLLHHTRKSNGYTKTKDDLRGSGDFAAFVDITMMINKKTNERYVISQPKNRLNKNLSNFSINFNYNEIAGATLEFDYWDSGENALKVAKSVERANDVDIWIKNNKISKFQTGDLAKEFPDWGFNARTDALKELKDRGKINIIKRGNWEVI